ncbi:MAG: hypothetical protein AB1798_14130, partial [Spirochaetota bacterium]
LVQDQKTLVYINPNEIESALEYEFLIAKQNTDMGRKHYAKKGGNFCIILPVLYKKRDPKKYHKWAAGFYDIVSKLAELELEKELFGFMKAVTAEMSTGLENILKNLRQDGNRTIQKAWKEIKLLYEKEEDPTESEKYAKLMIRFSRHLGLDYDELPLKKEHYKLFFTESSSAYPRRPYLPGQESKGA